MNKSLAIVFCGNDHQAAREFAASLRNGETTAVIADAYNFNRNEDDGHAYIMPDVPHWHRDRIVAAYPINTQVQPIAKIMAELPEARMVKVAARADELIVAEKRKRGRPRKVRQEIK